MNLEKIKINNESGYIWKGIYKDIPFEVHYIYIVFKYQEGEEVYPTEDQHLTDRGTHKKRVQQQVRLAYTYCEMQRKNKNDFKEKDVLKELDKELNKWKEYGR